MFDDETITDPDLSLMYVEAAKVLYGYLSGLQVAMPPAVFRTENGAEVLAWLKVRHPPYIKNARQRYVLDPLSGIRVNDPPEIRRLKSSARVMAWLPVDDEDVL